jgi:TRAP-type C4-dicarboxylate transport system permease large subunit
MLALEPEQHVGKRGHGERVRDAHPDRTGEASRPEQAALGLASQGQEAIGSVMGFVMTSEKAAELAGQWMVAWTDSKSMVLALVVLALLVMGIFLEAIPVMLIAVPLFGPLVVSYGVEPVHFGVVLTFAILLGIVHPPVGLGIFAVCAITKLRMEPVMRASLLFYPVLLLCTLLLNFVPALSTWLPSVMLAK